MSEENVERYHRVAEALERRDLDAFLAFFDPDVDFAPRSMFSVFPDYVAKIDEVRDLGDVTFGRVRLLGHGKGSGVPIEEVQWHVVQWRDGIVTRWHTLPTEAEALEAAGLSE